MGKSLSLAAASKLWRRNSFCTTRECSLGLQPGYNSLYPLCKWTEQINFQIMAFLQLLISLPMKWDNLLSLFVNSKKHQVWALPAGTGGQPGCWWRAALESAESAAQQQNHHIPLPTQPWPGQPDCSFCPVAKSCWGTAPGSAHHCLQMPRSWWELQRQTHLQLIIVCFHWPRGVEA